MARNMLEIVQQRVPLRVSYGANMLEIVQQQGAAAGGRWRQLRPDVGLAEQ